MKVIIDIPKEQYHFIKSHFRTESAIDMAIVNGKPLPESHGRLIDGDALEEVMRTRLSVTNCIKAVEDAPTVMEADREGR